MLPETLREALTFDDVLLAPAYSEVLPKDVDVSTRLTAKIALRMPLVSSAMDTVTEAATAIRMAREGGIGFLHKNMTIEQQAREVTKVKKAESGIVVDPVTIGPDRRLEDALALMRHYHISGLPVVDADKRPLGILTNRDVRFERNLTAAVADVMTKKLITVPGTTWARGGQGAAAREPHREAAGGRRGRPLKGLITIKDIEQAEAHPFAAKDELGRLRCGAAVGVGADARRGEALIEAGVDVIVVDTAHGHSKGVIEAVRALQVASRTCSWSAGNVATAEATRRSSRPASTRSRSASGRARSARPASSRASASRSSPRSPTRRRRQAATASRSSPTAASSSPATSPRPSRPARRRS
jgi:IMP dehydrogenase